MMPCGARLDHEWGKAFWEKNNPAQYFSDFALLSSRPGGWSLKSRGGSPTISGISLLPAYQAPVSFLWTKEEISRTREGRKGEEAPLPFA